MVIGRWVGPLSLVLLSWKATADELRTFAVWHDGKPAGTVRMRLSTGDGATECSVEVSVDERTTVGSLPLRVDEPRGLARRPGCRPPPSAEETQSRTSFHSTRYPAKCGRRDRRHRSLAESGRRTSWPLPPPGPVALLDADSGRVTAGRLERVRTETVQSAGMNVPATTYRVSGGREVTLWYDAGGRLVRQSWLVAGAEMVLGAGGVHKQVTEWLPTRERRTT